MSSSAVDVARYVLHLNNGESEPDAITHMRLQKLAYYCQGWHLGIRRSPLFADRIEAWIHGPVIPSVYRAFADFGDKGLPSAEGFDTGVLSDDDKRFVESIWDYYKRFSAVELRRKTHEETPWSQARGELAAEDRSDAEITRDMMKAWFGEQHRLSASAVHQSRTEFKQGRSIAFETLLAELP